MHVLICTDNPDVVETLRRGLAAETGRTTVCESGLDLLAAARTLSADLAVLDLDTPGLNGLLLISAVQELAPALPIVAVSARSEQDVRPLLQKGVRYVNLSRGLLQPLLAELGRTRGAAAAGPAR
jgi:DNA-binding response OmpR family regulator